VTTAFEQMEFPVQLIGQLVFSIIKVAPKYSRLPINLGQIIRGFL
jgi:hypothetical protein